MRVPDHGRADRLLTEREAEHLFEVIARLRAAGAGVIYISHRLDEISPLPIGSRCSATARPSARRRAPTSAARI
jgi:hypothetical protein